MTRMTSRTVADTRVYAQDIKPTDERDGILWVDTSVESRPVSVYSSTTAQWEPVSTDPPIFVTQEAVSFTETGVTTNPDQEVGLNSGAWSLKDQIWKQTSGITDQDSYTTVSDGVEIGALFTPKNDYGELEFHYEAGDDGTWDLYNHDSGSLLDSGTFSGNGTFRLSSVTFSAGTTYRIQTYGTTNNTDAPYAGGAPYENDLMRIDNGWKGGSTTSNLYSFFDMKPSHNPTTGAVTTSFDSIPDDLAAWDLATWQKDNNAGTVTTAVETNDGSGWSTLNSDAVAPYDISDVPPDSDVRVTHTLDRPTASDTSPVLSYVSRRGER